ncbi:membrane-bound lytic murein transglycosylase MltC [Candidatus Erwinia haradaeae]|uniref:Membrane-bound lytic murein transglycosylase C n=1 Tax=Candidatus Erwinia haradaeae TaxID=1922217 RepID=A0A451D1S8_9GAMM|nr:membrane-bound lytic murein transglycosylase MltC [Candidatus Erwinia haradaeae]VFP79566.1 Membrane-bound lytic murein transglycosylase C [Candidatus Erwinia haradaeae]
MNKNIILLCVICIFCTSCSYKEQYVYREDWIKDTNAFDILMEQFACNIDNIWGEKEVLIAGPKDYVKYSDKYHTRSHIDFLSGRIVLSTIDNANAISSLRKAIIGILLMSEDQYDRSIYSDNTKTTLNQEPLLYGEVLDNSEQPICNFQHAANYADYLLKNKRYYRYSGTHIICSVVIPMVLNHLDQRAHKYLHIVRKVSERYGISQSLILAIMEIESSFNQYAVSHSNALGLMQIVQNTAGLDVFRMKGKHGKPSRRYLLDPEKNIDAGTAYLSILEKNYFADVRNSLSRSYLVISSYHSGAGSVFRIFSSNRNKALNIINKLSPAEVYRMLTQTHPALESRKYLYKVHHAQKAYHNY